MTKMRNLGERLNTALGERYTVLRKIGSGGMATVFLAQDLKHERRVAIKVLHPDLAMARPERFLREIQIAAALQHPHILPLHDSGEADGLLFYVMPYVEGESLRDHLARSGELPIPDVVRILRDVADAMAAAHAQGIVHRDIKPDNVLLSGRHALVADFGVARALSEATGAEALTTAGVALGTPAYMAPEQAAGDALDHRADIYAFGVLAYELLTGRPPFEGAGAHAVVAGHLAKEPPPLSARRPAVPAALAVLVMRCLEKHPADRWQSAGELLAELERLATEEAALPASGPVWRRRRAWVAGLVGLAAVVAGAIGVARLDRESALDPQRIVVMPFVDRTGDPALAGVGGLVADWVTRELERALGEVVHVVSTASVRDALGGASADAASPLLGLAQAVEAGTAVTGTARLAEGRLRIETEIIDARGGTLLQALDPVGAPRDSVQALVSSAAERVVAAVASRHSPEFRFRRGQRPPPSLAAFREVEAGLKEFSRGRYREALVHFELAHAIDSSYAEPLLHAFAAYYSLGLAESAQLELHMQAAESVLVALAPLRHLLAAEERAELDWKQGWLHGDLDLEYRAAEESYRLRPGRGYQLGVSALRTNRPVRAIEAMSGKDVRGDWMETWPSYWVVYSNAYHLAGRLKEGVDVVERGRRLLADNPSLIQREIEIRAALGQVREVNELIDRAFTLPDAGGSTHAMFPGRAALEYRAHGHRETAEAVLRRGLAWLEERPPEEARAPEHRYDLARVLYWSGRWADALPIFEQLAREQPTSPDVLGCLGTTLARLGRREEALRVARAPAGAGHTLPSRNEHEVPGADRRGAR